MVGRWIIDLSQSLAPSPDDSLPLTITRTGHKEGAARVIQKLTRDGYFTEHHPFTPADLPDGEFLSNEEYAMSVHAGTHMDAPFHYGSLCEGHPARTIDEVPLEWCFRPGVRLDLTHKGAGESITPTDIEDALAAIDYRVQPLDIVLLHTGADRHLGSSRYINHFPGMTAEATACLVEQGVRVIGIDALGFDRPFGTMISEFAASGDPGKLWPAHFYGRTREYCHMERLANLGRIPKPFGFTVACFPIRLSGAGAAWVRAVAIGDG